MGGACRADLIKQSSAYTRTVLMTSSSDHISGATGLTLTVTASKAGAAYGAITPTVTEIGNGVYALALTGTHTGTLGSLDLHITAPGADPTDSHDQVVGFDPNDASLLGLTGIATSANQVAILAKTNLIGTNSADSPNQSASQGSVTTMQTRLGTPANISISNDIANVYGRLGAPTGASIAADIATANAGIAALPTATANAGAVWGAGVRTLTGLGTVAPTWYMAPPADYAQRNVAPGWWVAPPIDYQQRAQAVTLPASVIPAADVTNIVNSLLGATVDSGGGTTISVKQSLFLNFVASVGRFGAAVRSTVAPWTITVPFLRLDGTTTGWTYVTTYADGTFSKAVSRTFSVGTLP